MPAMAAIVNQYNLGVVSDDYKSESLAKAIQKLSIQELFICKKNAALAAKELSAEKNIEILRSEIKKLMN